jgi:hypothetical protein
VSNSFSKQETVAFDDLMVGFNDNLSVAKLVRKYTTDQTVMERSNYQIWRPMPYTAVSYSGVDMTNNFDDYTQMSVPASIDTDRSVPWQMTALELNDALQEKRLGKAAMQKLASDINVACLTRASLEGTLFVKRSSPATGFEDLAECEALMNEQGVSDVARRIALSTRDYNSMAADLSKASRSFGNEISDAALRRAYVGNLANFDTYKLDYALRLANAAGSGITMSTLVAGANFYVPQATSQGAAGQTSNVDNRYQTITVNSNTGVKAGDAFTIAGVEAAHHITKLSTGRLKTFRVIRPVGSTQLVISPPIISNQGGSDAEAQNVNVVLTSTASNAALVFLNTTTATMNPFWCEDAIEILPGRDSTPADAGAAVMRATTDNGIEVVMSKQYDIKTKKIFFRVDTRFGTVCTNPEMCGIVMFSQA